MLCPLALSPETYPHPDLGVMRLWTGNESSILIAKKKKNPPADSMSIAQTISWHVKAWQHQHDLFHLDRLYMLRVDGRVTEVRFLPGVFELHEL